MPRFILTRHGQTDFNAQQRYQGALDIPLNAEGEAQARFLTPRLASIKLDAAYTSDLQRAVKTAELALENHPSGLTAKPLKLLREINGGAFEGLKWGEFSSRYPEDALRWRFHANQTVEPQPDGGVTVRFRASGMLELAWHLFTWGDRVRVVRPDALRQVLADELQRALQAHLS